MDGCSVSLDLCSGAKYKVDLISNHLTWCHVMPIDANSISVESRWNMSQTNSIQRIAPYCKRANVPLAYYKALQWFTACQRVMVNSCRLSGESLATSPLGDMVIGNKSKKRILEMFNGSSWLSFFSKITAWNAGPGGYLATKNRYAYYTRLSMHWE